VTEQPVGQDPPTNAQTAKAAGELVALVESHLPQRFYRGEPYYRQFCAAAIVRMADTVEAVVALMAAGLPDDGLVLLRAFYEMVVRFMWVSIDPPVNVVHWGNEARRQSLILHNEVAQHGHTLLNERQIENATGASSLRPLVELADLVDEHWGGRMVGFSEVPIGGGDGMLSMRGMYTFVYRPGSAMAHMQPETLERYAMWETSPCVVDRPSKDDRSVWWPIMVPLYAHALIACHDQLNWPNPERVRAINNGMYV
jgi:hypothetical protein